MRVSKSDPNWPKPYSGSTIAAAMTLPNSCANTYTIAVSQKQWNTCRPASRFCAQGLSVGKWRVGFLLSSPLARMQAA